MEYKCDNFSRISLEGRKAEIVSARNSIRKSLDLISDKTSDYAEHHQHLINVYSEIIVHLNVAIIDSNSIGEGV